MHARAATLDDAADIARIYNEGIADRIGTFETDVRTADEVREWFDGTHPIVVVSDPARSDAIVAFASTSTYRPRACYDPLAEFSVYVARSARGHIACERDAVARWLPDPHRAPVALHQRCYVGEFDRVVMTLEFVFIERFKKAA